MPGQKKISSFFTTALTSRRQNISMKRPAEDSKASTSDSAKKWCAAETECIISPQQKSPIFKLLSPSEKAMGLDLMGESWFKALSAEFGKDYFKKLTKFVVTERKSQTIYPPVADVFSWTTQCNIKQVKVVILGQDPYHGPNQAHGLCFSVKKPVRPPPSLENMFKELSTDIEGFSHPGHGDLSGWAKQGVLLLNAVLTVRAQSANSHKDKGWEIFTDAVVKYINSHNAGVVFLLWGSYAQKKGSVIDKKRHHVLKCVHPSPLSAYRGFFGCKHFSQANRFLKAQGDPEINWCDL